MIECDTFVGPAELPQDLLGVPGVCNYAISLTGLLNGHTWQDGEKGEYTYMVKSGGRGHRTRQEVSIRVITHEEGDNGGATVQISHKVVPYKKFNRRTTSGYLEGRIFKFGPNTTLTGMPGGKKLIHGEYRRLQEAQDITPRT